MHIYMHVLLFVAAIFCLILADILSEASGVWEIQE